MRVLKVANSKLSFSPDIAQHEAERLVRDFARKQHFRTTQLASRMSSAMRMKGALGDPFAKLKDFTSNVHCDRSMSEFHTKATERWLMSKRSRRASTRCQYGVNERH